MHSRREEKCASRYSPVQQFDELVWNDLCEVLTHPESLKYALERAFGGQWLPQELLARRDQLRQAQTRLQHQINRLTDAYLNEVITLAEYQRRRSDLEQKLEAFNPQERQLDNQVDRHQELNSLTSSVEDFCNRVKSGLTNASFEQKRQIVELLIDRVIVSDGEVEIRYVIPTSPESEHIRFCHLHSDYLHYPPSGQKLEAFDIIAALDDFNFNFEIGRRLAHPVFVVDAIGPAQRKPTYAITRSELLKDPFGGVVVLVPSAVNDCTE